MILLSICTLFVYAISTVARGIFPERINCAIIALVGTLLIFLILKSSMQNILSKKSLNSDYTFTDFEKEFNKPGFIILELIFYFFLGLLIFQILPDFKIPEISAMLVFTFIGFIFHDIALIIYIYLKHLYPLREIFTILIFQETNLLIKSISTLCIIALLVSESLLLFILGVLAVSLNVKAKK